MTAHLRFIAAIVCLFAGTAHGADFNFNVLIRAGLAGPGDWEVGMGLNSAGVPTVSGHLSPYYLNDTPQRFEIGYRQSTGQAFTRIYADNTASVLLLNLVYHVPNAAPLSPTGGWTLPAGSFYTRASLNAQTETSVTASNMSLATGLSVLNPPSITARNNTVTAQNTPQGSPFLFQTASGDWMLTGELTMTGLREYVVNGATRSQLQFGLTAVAGETPEPASLLLLASALVWLFYRQRPQPALAIVRKPR
jgi:hypothetical protein